MKASAVPARGLLQRTKPNLLFGLVAFSVAMPLCLAICAVHGFSLLTGLLVAFSSSVVVTLVSGPVLKTRKPFRPDDPAPDSTLAAPAAPSANQAAAAHVRAKAVKLTNS